MGAKLGEFALDGAADLVGVVDVDAAEIPVVVDVLRHLLVPFFSRVEVLLLFEPDQEEEEMVLDGLLGRGRGRGVACVDVVVRLWGGRHPRPAWHE